MTADQRQVVTLDESPRLATMYAGALRPRRGEAPDDLPDLAYELADVTVDREHLAAYDRVCGFSLGDRLPPTYPHVLAFPLQVRLMTEPQFPFRLAGLVHVRNEVVRSRPLDAAVPLHIRVWTERLAPHPRGTTVDLVTRVHAGDDEEPAWSSVSTYLARGAKSPGATAATEQDDDGRAGAEKSQPPGRPVATWQVPRDTGRRYARVSGDLNPLHLHPLGARLLGFRGMIAHGMWTKARALAALEPRLPDALRAEVEFGRPLPLPSRPSLHVEAADSGWDLAVVAPDGRAHLTGAVRPA